jgi:hypothetical protein
MVITHTRVVTNIVLGYIDNRFACWMIIDVDPPQAALTIWAFRLLWLFCCPFSAAVAVFAGELAFKPVPKDGTTEIVALEVYHTIFLDTFLLLTYVSLLGW